MLARKRLSSKRVIILSGALVVVWGIIGVVVYRSFIAKPTPQATPITPVQPVVPETPGGSASIPTEGFDRSILQDQRLINLKVFGEVPLEVRARGNSNPFETYEP